MPLDPLEPEQTEMLQITPTSTHPLFPTVLCLKTSRPRRQNVTVFSNGEKFFFSTNHYQFNVPTGYIARTVVLPHCANNRGRGLIRTKEDLIKADYYHQSQIDNPSPAYQA